MNSSIEGDLNISAKPFTTEDLDRIEHELQIKLPGAYRKFMLARSKELLGYTYPLRGEPELLFDWDFFGFNVDRLISENTGQRRPDMAAGATFPGWWRKYFFFGSNGGGDYYALRLDGAPGVWFLACDAGTVNRYVDSLDEYVDQTLQRYTDDLKDYERLENLYQRKLRGEIEEAEFEKQWQEIIASQLPSNDGR